MAISDRPTRLRRSGVQRASLFALWVDEFAQPDGRVRSPENETRQTVDLWQSQIDQLGYDGLGFNEHHCSPYGLMNSPNLMAASAAQRTKHVRLLIYGNL